MLEEIRVYIMERWEKNRHRIQIYPDIVLPNIKKKLEKESAYTSKWLTRYVYNVIGLLINLYCFKYVSKL